MLKSITLLAGACLLFVSAQAQNLVPNGSFEELASCPTQTTQITRANGWDNFNTSTSDCYNSCNSGGTGLFHVGVPSNVVGNEAAAQGSGYAGTYVTAAEREYITRTINPMTPGVTYEVAYSISLAEIAIYVTDDFSAFFYKNGPSSYPGVTAITLTPQVNFRNFGIVNNTNGWTRLSKTYVADSAYDHIAIGCFSSPSAINIQQIGVLPNGYGYYYIDSVVVKAVHGISISNAPATVCATEGTIQVAFATHGTGYYMPGNVFTLELSDASGSFANPTVLGTVNGTASGTISGPLPMGITPGTGYKLRITSNSGADISATTDLIISPINTNLNAIIGSTPANPQPGQPIIFTVATANAGTSPAYQWRKNGQDIPGANANTWSTTGLHPYDEITCKVTSSETCASPTETVTGKVVVNFPASVQGVEAGSAEVQIYPNPNNGTFTVSAVANITAVQVLNIAGQKVYSAKAVGKNVSVNIPSSLADGAYILRVETDMGMMQQRFTLQR